MPSPDVRLALLYGFFLLSIDGSAQQIQNVRAEFDGEKVIIVYDLIAEQDDNRLKVLSENKDKYLTSEDLFDEIRPGMRNNSDTRPLFGEIQNVGDEGGNFVFI